jgi:hypothetical protein
MQAEATPETIAPATRPAKAKASLEQQIETLEARTRKLREQLKEEQRREREKNARAVLELLHNEKLEDFGIETWKSKIAEIRKLLQSAKV